MNEKEEKRDFTKVLAQVATSLTEEAQKSKGRGFILIGSDCITNADGNDDEQTTLAVGGSGKEIISSLAQFISNPQTRPLFEEAIKLATAIKLKKGLTGVIEALAKGSEKEEKESSTNK